MQLPSLLRRASGHVARHADEHRAPTGTVCDKCKKPEPGTNENPIVLAQCSFCETWFCTPHYTMHEAPDGWDAPVPPLWLRLWRKAARRG